ncbi:hypothetical protein [Mycoplasmopsis californica]|uniref:hypothetical protein n=1 Tax=Mycoplasmopsis californica TaxID=2113 RepID=UPI000596D1A9|nr:hypothetical protein [Mycoplasmopsis californica]
MKNGKIRRKIIAYSKSRTNKDARDKKILIGNFKNLRIVRVLLKANKYQELKSRNISSKFEI